MDKISKITVNNVRYEIKDSEARRLIDILSEKKANKNEIGSPLATPLAEGFTDTTKIYVYTGCEEGYENGYWYFYNGKEWEPGGIYNSVAIETDETLTLKDAPADSKAVGDRIKELEENLTLDKTEMEARVEEIRATYAEFNIKYQDIVSKYNELRDKYEELKLGVFDGGDAMEKTYLDFYTSRNGRAYDHDGYYGAQCWDGYVEYCKYFGYEYAHCGLTGYVQDLWNQRQSNGILNYFYEVTEMEPGDVTVFKVDPNWTPYSHVAIFHSDAGDGYGWFFGQNQGGAAFVSGGSAFNLVKLPYSATFPTAFRPKAFVNKVTASTLRYSDPVDQVLNPGSWVSSVPMKIGEQGVKTVGGKSCCYLERLGGWFPVEYVSEYDASDGNKDNYLANTNAKVFVDRTQVEEIDVAKNLVKIKGIWVKTEPLVEVD